MKNKIPIVGFIIAILLLAPISGISKETIITNTYNKYDYKLKLNFEEITSLCSAIINIKDTEVRNTILTIYNENINENDELNAYALSIMINRLADYSTTDYDIYDYIELINAILDIIINHLLELPVFIVTLLLEDVITILDYIKKIVQDMTDILSGDLTEVLVALFALFTDVNRLVNKIKQLPTTMDDFKEYAIERIENAINETLESIVQDIADTVWEFAEPRLGYINKFAISIVNIVTITPEFINHLITKSEHFKIVFIDLPKAFMDLKNAPESEKLKELIEFGTFILNSINSIMYVINDLTDQQFELLDEGTEIYDNLIELRDYYNSEPWNLPIIIQGNVTNIDDDAIIGFTDPAQTDSEIITEENTRYSIEYVTSNSENSYLYHTFIVKATSADKEKTYQRTAFSDGVIELPIDFSKDKSKQKPIILEIIEKAFYNNYIFYIELLSKIIC
jgi:hypothetical protein